MNKISSRQLYFFLSCIAPLGKLILLPARLVEFTRNDLLFPVLIHLILQAASIYCIMLLSRRNQTLFSMLENTFGRIAASVLFGVLSLFFLYAAIFPLIEQKLLVQSVFYDTLPSSVTFAPFFILSAYVCAKPLFHHGRMWDVLAPISAISLFAILLFAMNTADMGAISPVGSTGVSAILKGTQVSFLWFYDSAILLPFVGSFRYEKGMAVKATSFYLLGGAFVLVFLALFYGVFSDIAIRQTFAFAKISKYFSASAILGRIDYIFICLLAIAMALYTLLPVHAGVHCMHRATQGKVPQAILSLAVNLGLLVLLVSVNFLPNEVLAFIGEKAFYIFPLFCLVLPPLCLLLRRSTHEEKIA